MEYNDIIKELRSKLTEDAEANDKFLRSEGDRFAREGNTDGVAAVGELIMELMPEDRRKEVERLTTLDGESLDAVHDKIVKLLEEKKILDALPLAERLYKKITLEYAEGEKAKFVSLRNPFEDNLCQVLFKTDKVLNRAPFDFATFLTTYAYLLVETGSTVDAIPVLEKAIEFNPVDVGPRFELAEIYKVIKNKKKLIQITQETLAVASSPVALARCYANMGYMLTDQHEFDDAAAFYIASVQLVPNPAIPLEMQNLANMKGTPIVRPTNEEIAEVMKKYDIEYGPNQKVIEVAAQLSQNYLIEKNIPYALQTLKILYNLTFDEKVKDIILRLDPNSPMAVPKQNEEQTENKPNIIQTVNDSPEE